MVNELEGDLQGAGLRIAIAASRFNDSITTRLVGGALTALQDHGVRESDITIAWTPGSFELPLIAKRLAISNSYDAIVCLGAVIKGETAHFDHVAGEAASGIATVSRETGVPIAYGVLATHTITQAKDRAGGKYGNRGYDSALVAIQMANLVDRLQSEPFRAPSASAGGPTI